MLLLAMCRPGGQAPDPRPPAPEDTRTGITKWAWWGGLRAASEHAAWRPWGRDRFLLPAPVTLGCPPDWDVPPS